MRHAQRKNAVSRILPRKPPPKRAFTGVAGSPLAKLAPGFTKKKYLARKMHVDAELASVAKTDHTLRAPQTPDREAPVEFDVWFDSFGQRHAQIDLDAAFQEYAFDPHLRRGAKPDNFDSKIGVGVDLASSEASKAHAGGEDIKPDRSRDKNNEKDKRGYGLGLLEHEREIKRRRRTKDTWWIFETELLRDFLKTKYSPITETKNYESAVRAMLVLYGHYILGREDKELAQGLDASLVSIDPEDGSIDESNSVSSMTDVKKVKQLRQYLVREGTKMFAGQRSTYRQFGRIGRSRGGACDDPGCTQCKSNDRSMHFS